MIDRLVTRFEILVITLGFAVATLLLFTNVVLRYAFDIGFVWVLELVQYLFAWVVLIGAAHGVKAGIHLGIDVLTSRFSRPVQRRLALFSLFICLLFVVPLLWLFVLSSHFLTTGGVSARLVEFAKAMVGWMHGGLRWRRWSRACSSLPSPAHRRPR